MPSPPPHPSTAIPKHRENFTIRMPPMSTQSNTNQLSQGELTAMADPNNPTASHLDLTRLNKDES